MKTNFNYLSRINTTFVANSSLWTSTHLRLENSPNDGLSSKSLRHKRRERYGGDSILEWRRNNILRLFCTCIIQLIMNALNALLLSRLEYKSFTSTTTNQLILLRMWKRNWWTCSVFQIWLSPITNYSRICKIVGGKRFHLKEDFIVKMNAHFEGLDQTYYLEDIDKLDLRWTKCSNPKGVSLEKKRCLKTTLDFWTV